MTPARRPSAVLDTNVVVSGALTRSGPPFEILHHWYARRFTLVLSDSVNHEYHRVFSELRSNRKLKLRGFDVNDFQQLLAVDAVWVEHEVASLVRARDPKDNHLLSAA